MNRLMDERHPDPYRRRQKLPEPSVCPVCHAVCRDGRWQWAKSWPENAHEQLCQACRRVRDRCPAGAIRLQGTFLQRHKAEILNLVHNQEADEKADHPLHRIMNIEERADTITIQTTDIHLPRRIGEALRRAFKGNLELQYDQSSCVVRVNWTL